MDDAKTSEVCQWITKARHDLRFAQLLFSADPPLLDTAVYHCQQVAEKALKAYLTWHDIPFQKIHNLPVLVEQCLHVDKTFSELHEMAEILTPYATAFRYPGEVLEPEIEDAQEALEAAEELLRFILERIPVESRGE